MPTRTDDDAILVLYDGDCGICIAAVWFIIDRDPGACFRFAPLAGRLGVELRSAHGLEDVDSIIVVEGGRAWIRTAAALRILLGLGWPWRLAGVLLVIPAPIRDLAYRLFARVRRRFRRPQCRIATPEQHRRFIT